ncbi:MAG TPA: carbohydrate porin [Stellaceae bacterium]|nr:carbohydrate porin [Stellaceae bacterium]
MPIGRGPRCLAPALLLMLAVVPALAQSASDAQKPGSPAGLWDRPNLLGDLGGLRPALDEFGATLSLSEVSEVLGNVTGGVRRGFAYDGLTTASLKLDTKKAFHWSGGTFFVSALQIHGRSLSADNLLTIQTASGIEADRATRLWELWLQQEFPAGIDVKIGQQSLDQEFITSSYAALYFNTAMGWPALPSVDLYAGGPAYPLSSLGIRLRAKPTKALTVLAGVFDDNPPGGPFFDDPQRRDGEASGTRFNLGTGALWIAEIQYAPPDAALSGTYKLGMWFDTARFPDRRFDAAGLSLADPASSGIARQHRGNFSLYGVVDRQLWRAAAGPRALGGFLRLMGAPGDRNLVDWALNVGLNLKAPFPGRDDDTFGISYDWAHVGNGASAFDRDVGRFAGIPFPVRDAEHVIEITYQYQAAPWWAVQPDLQYAIDPGGAAANPHDPIRRLGNELVIGLRTTITF